MGLFSRKKKETVLNKSQIFPIVKIKNNSISGSGDIVLDLPVNKHPIQSNFVGDLIVMYAIDTGENYTFINAEQLVSLEISKEDLHHVAIENLDRITDNISIEGDGNSFQIKLDGNLDSSLILLPKIWIEIQEKIESEPILIMPGRELVYFFRSTWEGLNPTISQLQEMKFDSQKLHILNNDAYIWKNNEWEVFKKS